MHHGRLKVERERQRLHQLAQENGITHERTLAQSQLVDKLVVEYMKKQYITKCDKHLRHKP